MPIKLLSKEPRLYLNYIKKIFLITRLERSISKECGNQIEISKPSSIRPNRYNDHRPLTSLSLAATRSTAPRREPSWTVVAGGRKRTEYEAAPRKLPSPPLQRPGTVNSCHRRIFSGRQWTLGNPLNRHSSQTSLDPSALHFHPHSNSFPIVSSRFWIIPGVKEAFNCRRMCFR